MTISRLDALFANLDRWRHLPNYQLERRADIFFSLYLVDLLREVTGVDLEDTIVPELPIKRDLIWADLPTDKSVKVDYVLFAKDRSRVFFVELKTDNNSLNEKQKLYLRRARELGFPKIVEGLCSIIRSTTAHRKYHHLLSLLGGLGYVTMPADIREYLYPRPRPGLSARLEQIAPSALESTIEVVYIQPTKTEGDHGIDFETFAEFVGRHDDPLSRTFATHLRKWRDAAGACVPPG